MGKAHQVAVVTGSDTGVGKSVVTALLAYGLRRQGLDIRAVKPISTGDRGDGLLLRFALGGNVELEEINPFHFRRPVAPLCAARVMRSPLRLADVMAFLRRASGDAERLLVEGAGGWRTPLGEGFGLPELCAGLGRDRVRVVVVVANRLGALHQALCVVESVERLVLGRPAVVLSSLGSVDAASRENARVLRELLPGRVVVEWPYCGPPNIGSTWFEEAQKKCKKSLASLAAAVNFTPAFRGRSAGRKKRSERD